MAPAPAMAPWPVVPAGRPRHLGWWWAIGAAGLVLLVLGGALGWWYARVPQASHPTEWDPRVAGLADFVAHERGLSWRHPVDVAFVPAADFAEQVTVEEAGLTDEERAEQAVTAGWYRALGLAEGEIDLLARQNQATTGAALAFYDPGTDRIYVRDDDGAATAATTAADLPPDLRATLVHELTHALQDQLTDLSRFEGPEGDPILARTFRAVVEGDARRIEQAYLAVLPPEERATYEEALADLVDRYRRDVAGVPPALLVFQAAPYELGAPFLDVVTAAEGAEAVDRLLFRPPPSEEHLLDPQSHLDNDRPLGVVAPSVPEGGEVIEQGTLGAVTWYLLLGARIDPTTALAAADGWGGDAYVFYRDQGRACFRISYRGDDLDETGEMEAALEGWLNGLPAGMATVERTGGSLLVRTCDPGPDAALGARDGLGDLLRRPAARAEALAATLRTGGG